MFSEIIITFFNSEKNWHQFRGTHKNINTNTSGVDIKIEIKKITEL